MICPRSHSGGQSKYWTACLPPKPIFFSADPFVSPSGKTGPNFSFGYSPARIFFSNKCIPHIGLNLLPLLDPTNPKCCRRQWHPTPVLLPGKSHGRRSLVGCSPWGREESDTTERLPFHFSLSCIGDGNGVPLQCSCLENPRDGGAWWAAIYGVTQSRTRLK